MQHIPPPRGRKFAFSEYLRAIKLKLSKVLFPSAARIGLEFYADLSFFIGVVL